MGKTDTDMSEPRTSKKILDVFCLRCSSSTKGSRMCDFSPPGLAFGVHHLQLVKASRLGQVPCYGARSPALFRTEGGSRKTGAPAEKQQVATCLTVCSPWPRARSDVLPPRKSHTPSNATDVNALHVQSRFWWRLCSDLMSS